MSVLYVLPLILVLPFIPLKAKAVRRLTVIEFGHKWVDLLLGEIYFFFVFFNFQYFMVSAIVSFEDGRNTLDYKSTMIVFFGGLATFGCLIGLICKPEIYGNFRTVFKYDKELRTENLDKVLRERKK